MIDLAPVNFIFVALPCEARPLIKAWNLKKITQKQAFASYGNEFAVLTVSGIGKVAMAGAVAYTLAQYPDVAEPVMLNIGIAGHNRLPVGSCLLADRIADADSGRRFYPQLPFTAPCPTRGLTTFAQAAAEYCGDYLRDMEASAFYETAVKFSSSELIHCLKVVSDNSESPLANVTEDSVADWIGASLPVVEALLTRLAELANSQPTPDRKLYREALGRFHFTASNAAKLQAVLNRWRLVYGEPADLNRIDAKNAKDLLAQMEALLAEKQFYL